MNTQRLKDQLEFLLEADKLKNLYRQTYVSMDDVPSFSPDYTGEKKTYPRKENDAEHSFSLALFTVILSEYANEKIDILRTVKMVLIHDIVEIDAGDTFCYDTDANKSKLERELKAADRLFAILPKDQHEEYRALWDEFEERATPESKFANAMDRIQPLLLNIKRDGMGWKEHGIRYGQVTERNKYVADGSNELWEHILGLLKECNEKGILPD